MAGPPIKRCVVCSTDLANRQRVKDPHGNYYCPPCYDQRAAAAREQADNPSSAPPHLAPVAPSATPDGAEDEITLLDEPARRAARPQRSAPVTRPPSQTARPPSRRSVTPIPPPAAEDAEPAELGECLDDGFDDFPDEPEAAPRPPAPRQPPAPPVPRTPYQNPYAAVAVQRIPEKQPFRFDPFWIAYPVVTIFAVIAAWPIIHTDHFRGAAIAVSLVTAVSFIAIFLQFVDDAFDLLKIAVYAFFGQMALGLFLGLVDPSAATLHATLGKLPLAVNITIVLLLFADDLIVFFGSIVHFCMHPMSLLRLWRWILVWFTSGVLMWFLIIGGAVVHRVPPPGTVAPGAGGSPYSAPVAQPQPNMPMPQWNPPPPPFERHLRPRTQLPTLPRENRTFTTPQAAPEQIRAGAVSLTLPTGFRRIGDISNQIGSTAREMIMCSGPDGASCDLTAIDGATLTNPVMAQAGSNAVPSPTRLIVPAGTVIQHVTINGIEFSFAQFSRDNQENLNYAGFSGSTFIGVRATLPRGMVPAFKAAMQSLRKN